MIKKTGYVLFAFFFYLFRLFPVNRQKVFFVATHDDSKEGNIGIVADAIKNQFPSMKMVYLTKKDGIRSPFSFFFGKAFHMATASVIFLDNEFMPMAYMKFNKNVKVVQLWHGTGTIKKFGLDSDTGEVKRLAKKANENITHLIVSSECTAKWYKSAFGVDDEKIFPIGLPRTDLMLDDSKRQKMQERFFEQYPDLRGKRITLYAPTFRDSQVENPEICLDFDSLNRCMGENEVLLIRLHPHVAEHCPAGIWDMYPDKIRNVSDYPGVATLLSVADQLITDYSSIIYEYCLLKRKMIFYAYDYEVFQKDGRNFYEDYEKFVPGMIVYTQPELEKIWHTAYEDDSQREQFCGRIFKYQDKNAVNRLLCLIFDKK